MSSPSSPRDPVRDHVLTPQNAAPLIIDYQRKETAKQFAEILFGG